MADPVLDEDNILHMLSAPLTLDTLDYVQSGAAQALVDLYDRKVTREQFIALASPVLAFYAQIARLRMIVSVDEVFAQGTLDQATLDKAKVGIVTLLEKQRGTVVDTVKKLMECPTSEDRVH